jgi:hypothetical protein
MQDDLNDAANEENAMRRVGIAKWQLSVPADFDTMGAAEIQAMFEGDIDLVHAVLSAHIVTYCVQWNNRHTLEARAFGIAQNQRSVFVGFLGGTDQMGPPEQPWMSIDDLGSITLTGNAYPSKRPNHPRATRCSDPGNCRACAANRFGTAIAGRRG